MQTSKFLLVIGAAMFFSAPSLLAAKPETEAQAKMREALRLKMEELSAQEMPPASVPVVATEAPEPAPAVEIPKPAPVVTPKPVKVKAEPAKPKTVVVPVPVEAPVVAPTKAKFSEPVADADPAAAARTRDALQQKMSELNATPNASIPQTKVVVAPVNPAPAKATAPAISTSPVIMVAPAAKIEAPASPLPVTKQDRLAELLSRYKADQLSAQDYHTQRAAILSE